MFVKFSELSPFIDKQFRKSVKYYLNLQANKLNLRRSFLPLYYVFYSSRIVRLLICPCSDILILQETIQLSSIQNIKQKSQIKLSY